MTTATLHHHEANQSFNDLGDLFKPSKQDKLFKQILWLLLLVYVVFAVVVPMLEQVELPREVKEQVPPQLAKIILQEKQLPPPVKPEVKPPEPEPLPKLEPELAPPEEKVPEKPVEQAVKPQIVQPTTREAAKESQHIRLSGDERRAFFNARSL